MVTRLLVRGFSVRLCRPYLPQCGQALKHDCPRPRIELYQRQSGTDSVSRDYRETGSIDIEIFIKRAQDGEANLKEAIGVFEENQASFSPRSLLEYFKVLLKVATREGVVSSLALDPKTKGVLDRVAATLPSLSHISARMCLQYCAKSDLQYPPLHSALIGTLTQRAPHLHFASFYGIIQNLQRLKLLQKANTFVLLLAERMRMDADWSEEVDITIAYSRAAWALSKVGCLPESVVPDIHAYVESNVTKFNFHSISIILWVIVKHGKLNNDDLLEKVAQHAARLLQEEDNISPQSLSLLCWVFGTMVKYHKNFFQAVSHFICDRCSEAQGEPRMLASVAWACARVSYYDPRLMNRIAGYVVDSVQKFSHHDLGNLAYSFGFLNHECAELLSKIADHLMTQPGMTSNTQTLGNTAWACLIHKVYHKPLLARVASLPSINKMQLATLLHLNIAVQKEAPHLDISIPSDVLNEALISYVVGHTQVYSVFQSNVTQALKKLFGDSSHFTTEAITKGGYILDAEVLLDSEGKAVPIPGVLRHQNLPNLIRIVANTPPKRITLHANPASPSVDGLIGVMKGSEKGNAASHTTRQLRDLLTSFTAESYSKKMYFLASDWLKTDAVNCIRKLAIEADGPFHFASNCHHTLGHTVLKHRLLEALGWQVISIPHFEWELLETDDDQAHYLAKKIFP